MNRPSTPCFADDAGDDDDEARRLGPAIWVRDPPSAEHDEAGDDGRNTASLQAASLGRRSKAIASGGATQGRP